MLPSSLGDKGCRAVPRMLFKIRRDWSPISTARRYRHCRILSIRSFIQRAVKIPYVSIFCRLRELEETRPEETRWAMRDQSYSFSSPTISPHPGERMRLNKVWQRKPCPYI